LRALGHQNLVLGLGLAWGRRVLKGALLLAGLFLALLGAARLQGKPVPEDLQLSGVDLMIVVDVSKSMLTQDLIPNRMEAAKKAVLSWLEGREGDRAGVVVFAGEAILQVPLTLDLQAVSLVLEQAAPDAVDRGGTDIGKGIRAALAGFPKEEEGKRGRALLLLTDGEATEGSSNLAQACLEAKEMKVPIVAVGVGTRQGRPIPDGVSFWGEAVYKRDRSGNVRVSRLDEEALAKIADITGGRVVHGDSPENLSAIGKTLEGLKQTSLKGKGAVRRQELAPSLAAGAAAALLLCVLL
jgi:Ca-activated chloride channel family protein